jgi:cephalosporin-C deacetylase-like acetyl esterase
MKQRLTTIVTLVLALFVQAALCAQTPPATSAYKLLVVTDRPEALYSVGERVKFVINVKEGASPVSAGEVTYQLDKDGMPPVNRGKAKLENGTATVEGTLSEPGFLSCRVSFSAAGQKPLTALAGAGFDPTKIPPSLPVPDDFDAFWAKQKEQLRAVPMQPVLTSVPSPQDSVECFDVQISCPGWRPVSAYLARPKGAAPRSLPIILSVHGAGVRSSILAAAAGNANSYKALAMDLNANGLPNGKPDQFYKDLADGELKDYRTRGREDREKCYFLGMFLRLVRAMDYLTSQPEWDGKHLIVIGGSQGGGQSIAAAGLDPRVTLICAGVPALCDHSGKVIGRANGWPRLVPDVDGKPDPKVLQVARYFDCMNFASRAKAEAVFSVGFIDTTCPPTSVYAAYNAIPGKKQIINEPLMGHASSPRAGKANAEAIQRHIRSE